jgi:hypothetical protein
METTRNVTTTEVDQPDKHDRYDDTLMGVKK